MFREGKDRIENKKNEPKCRKKKVMRRTAVKGDEKRKDRKGR